MKRPFNCKFTNIREFVSYLYQTILKEILDFLQISCVFLILPFQKKFQIKPTENLPCLTRQDAGYPGLFPDWRERIWRMESDINKTKSYFSVTSV